MGSLSELHAALLQGAVTLGTAALCWYLFAKYRRQYFLWLSVSWSLYVLRIGAIMAFVLSGDQPWLFAHQILTGWTALVLLGAALSFTQRVHWRLSYLTAPVLWLAWSYVAIYQLESFMLAAMPAVIFLSFATLLTGAVFYKQWRRTGSRGGAVLAGVLLTWGVHHLDYPILRARGAWNPWGYYLDILFVLAMGIGIVILVLEELDARTKELERLSARMVQQHEEERRRVSLELHDQTAQVWAAVKMQLGLVREDATAPIASRIDRVLNLVDTGIRSIRGVTTNLRPPLLDDLGLIPALRALVQSFGEQTGLALTFEAPARIPLPTPEAQLALFRALQEALSNVARHSGATAARVTLTATDEQLTLLVEDNGHGIPSAKPQGPGPTLGLTGMRERIGALHGSVELQSGNPGASITIKVPLHDAG